LAARKNLMDMKPDKASGMGVFDFAPRENKDFMACIIFNNYTRKVDFLSVGCVENKNLLTGKSLIT